MTFTIPIAAAVLLLSATVAQANPTTTSTDEARAMAGRALPPDELATVAATPARFPMTTDEARALAGGAIRAASPTTPVKGTMARAQACSCKHG